MSRLVMTAALALGVFALFVAAEEPKQEKPTVDLSGSIADETLQKEAPEDGVIASKKAWEKLANAWGVKGPAKVDFGKEILVVGTTVGSRLNVSTKLDAEGDLKVTGMATADIGPGFRYVIKSVNKEGVKTVNGKTLPKD